MAIKNDVARQWWIGKLSLIDFGVLSSLFWVFAFSVLRFLQDKL